jgi:futalosine hydrolase
MGRMIEICTMKIVLVAATQKEIEPTLQWLEKNKDLYHHPAPEILVTGVGLMNVCFSLTNYVHNTIPDLIVQAGVAGSFDKNLLPGTLVTVKEEILGDCGVWENNQWNDLFDMGLDANNNGVWEEKKLINPNKEMVHLVDLQEVRSLTVNQVSTDPIIIQALCQKYQPDIESMEGAVFHYVCLKKNIPFVQIRAISNIVGDRNKANWQMQPAIETLNRKTIQLLQQFTTSLL